MEEIKEKIFSMVESLQPRLIEALKMLVAEPSVKGKATTFYPFGREVAHALERALRLSEELEFATYNGDFHWGYAATSLHGDEDYIAVIGHLDVVPAGEGWQSNPFRVLQIDKRLYGRGVLDNKGPTLAALFALKALKDAGVVFKRPVRIIFGCDEESGFADLEHYLAHEKPPLMGFTPDCKYPVVYAERGRLKLAFISRPEDRAVFNNFITSYLLQDDKNGRRLGIAHRDDEFGALELRDYRLELHEDELRFALSISYPASITSQELLTKIAQVLPHRVEIEVLKNYDPVRFDPDSPMLKAMVRAYEEITGNDGTPVTTTGGTYAKLMPNIVPFGPSFPGQKGIAHQPDEWLDIDDLMTNVKIYALALYYLLELD